MKELKKVELSVGETHFIEENSVKGVYSKWGDDDVKNVASVDYIASSDYEIFYLIGEYAILGCDGGTRHQYFVLRKDLEDYLRFSL